MSNLKKSVFAVISASAALLILTGCGGSSDDLATSEDHLSDITVSTETVSPTESLLGENGCLKGQVPDTTLLDDSYGLNLPAYSYSYTRCTTPEQLEVKEAQIATAQQRAEAAVTELTQVVNNSWDKLGTLVSNYCSRANSHKTYVSAARELWEANWVFPNAYDLPQSFDAAMSQKCDGNVDANGSYDAGYSAGYSRGYEAGDDYDSFDDFRHHHGY